MGHRIVGTFLVTSLCEVQEDGLATKAQRQLQKYLSEQKQLLEDLRDSLEKYRERLEAFVRRELRPSGLDGQVNARIKLWKDIRPKLEEGRTILEIGDLVGVRVVVMYADQMNEVASCLRRTFEGSLTTRKWSSAADRKAGYAGFHAQMKPGFSLRGIRAPLHKMTAELQIRTHLQHVWAELSHPDFYKEETGVPLDVRERLYRLSGSLDLLGDEVVSLREMLTNVTQQTRQAIRDPAKDAWKHVELDEFSLTLVSNDRLDEALDELRSFGVDSGFRESAWPEPVKVGAETDVFVPYARSLGIETLGDFDKLVKSWKRWSDRLADVGQRMVATHGDAHNFFARPLYLLCVVLMLEHPARPCTGLPDRQVSCVQGVLFERPADWGLVR